MSGADDSMDLELAAASLRADGTDVRILVEVLADRLAEALGSRLTVERARKLGRRSGDVRSIQIRLDDDQFEAVVDGDALRCSIGHTSGGIRIRSDKVGVDEWLTRLLAVLKAEAANSQAVRLALESIVIGGNQ